MNPRKAIAAFFLLTLSFNSCHAFVLIPKISVRKPVLAVPAVAVPQPQPIVKPVALDFGVGLLQQHIAAKQRMLDTISAGLTVLPTLKRSWVAPLPPPQPVPIPAAPATPVVVPPKSSKPLVTPVKVVPPPPEPVLVSSRTSVVATSKVISKPVLAVQQVAPVRHLCPDGSMRHVCPEMRTSEIVITKVPAPKSFLPAPVAPVAIPPQVEPVLPAISTRHACPDGSFRHACPEFVNEVMVQPSVVETMPILQPQVITFPVKPVNVQPAVLQPLLPLHSSLPMNQFVRSFPGTSRLVAKTTDSVGTMRSFANPMKSFGARKSIADSGVKG